MCDYKKKKNIDSVTLLTFLLVCTAEYKSRTSVSAICLTDRILLLRIYSLG